MPLLLGQLGWGWGTVGVTPNPLLCPPCVTSGGSQPGAAPLSEVPCLYPCSSHPPAHSLLLGQLAHLPLPTGPGWQAESLPSQHSVGKVALAPG